MLGPFQVTQVTVVHPQPDDGCPLEDQRGLSRRSHRQFLHRLLGQVDGVLQVSHLVGQVGSNGGRIGRHWQVGSLGLAGLCNLQGRFYLFQVPGKEQSPGIPHKEHGIIPALLARQLGNQLDKLVGLPADNERCGDLVNQAGGTLQVAGRQGVLDGLIY